MWSHQKHFFFNLSLPLRQVIGWRKEQDTPKHKHKLTLFRNSNVPVCITPKNSSMWSQSLREQGIGVNAKLSPFLWEMFPLRAGDATQSSSVVGMCALGMLQRRMGALCI